MTDFHAFTVLAIETDFSNFFAGRGVADKFANGKVLVALGVTGSVLMLLLSIGMGTFTAQRYRLSNIPELLWEDENDSEHGDEENAESHAKDREEDHAENRTEGFGPQRENPNTQLNT